MINVPPTTNPISIVIHTILIIIPIIHHKSPVTMRVFIPDFSEIILILKASNDTTISQAQVNSDQYF